MPATIWYMIILAQEELGPKSMNNPKPVVMKIRPHQIGGRYWPVFRMNMPVNAERKLSDNAVGNK